MKLIYLGTAAAEGFPALFCQCPACRRAAAAGGRNLRTRSQAVVDGQLLLDFPPDTLYHVQRYGLNLAEVRHCLITHGHSDHLYAPDLEMRRRDFAYPEREGALTLYGTGPTGALCEPVIAQYGLAGEGRVRFRQIAAFMPFSAGPYRVVALPADHDPRLEPVIYHISDGARGLLYAHDTGVFPGETWRYLEAERPRIDLLSLDCNHGPEPHARNHLGLEDAARVRDRLAGLGCLANGTAVVNHFSHNGGATYDELAPRAAALGLAVSWDGMEVEA